MPAQKPILPSDRIRPGAGPHPAESAEPTPGLVMLTCANCGAAMDERKCKLICRCGYLISTAAT